MKKKISITVDEDLIEWAKKQVETKRYRSLSHIFEYALEELREKMMKET